jgi:hypothetical protein
MSWKKGRKHVVMALAAEPYSLESSKKTVIISIEIFTGRFVHSIDGPHH